MNIEGVIWLREVVDKLAVKHHVETDEVEEVFNRTPKFRFVEKGERAGEDVYLALGWTREDDMAGSKSRSLTHFKSLDELAEFFDTHDLGEYWDEMPEAHFEVNMKRRMHLIAIDDELADRLTEIARSQHTSSENLINSWLILLC